ncbi:MAG: DsbA family protein [Gemmatimonadota bacterium]|nr:DsbA family protein [Gemmatimonadota bacterium]
MSRRAMFGLGSVLVLLVAAGFSAFRSSSADGAGAGDESLIAQRTKGSAAALLTVYEMSDFQCPYCRKQAIETFPLIEKEFIATGKVRWIFLQFPLTQIHANALPAAEFSMCAARAGKFWPVHDLLFEYQQKWAPLKDPAPFLLSLADSVGLSRDEMTQCLARQEMREIVRGEAEGAAQAGVQSTPTVYIDGAGLLAGAAPIELYRRVLDSLWTDRNAAKKGS